MSKTIQKIVKFYISHRGFFQKSGVIIGRPRLAVLTEKHGERDRFSYNSDEFWRTDDPAIYVPRYTLDEIVRREHLEYRGGVLVKRFREGDGHVSVFAEDLQHNEVEEFRAKKLILAAGTLNTAKLVLQSFEDTSSRLPLLDNPVSYIPLLDPFSIGAPFDSKAFGLAQLKLVYEDATSGIRVLGGIYSYTSGLRSDLFFDFPLSVIANLACCKYLLPALSVIQLLYPSVRAKGNYVQLSRYGRLRVVWRNPVERGSIERRLIKVFRRCGYLSHISLCQFPVAGTSVHYAGTLPMSDEEGQYTVDRSCRLRGAHNVFIADAATFPALPCKNLTFTLMANAMRVADYVERTFSN
jgi:hypothetical protein